MNKYNFDEFGDFDFKSNKIDMTISDNTTIKYNLPWVEKFRPSLLKDIISNDKIVSTLKDYVKKKYLPHLLICGPSGTGKTSVINACAKELYGEYFGMMTLHINASEERGIEIIRNKVKDFVMAKNIFDDCVDFKLVILDEADAMTISAQSMLRRMIEDFTFNVRFCLICNKLKNIDPAIQSRCVMFRFSQLNNDDVLSKLKNICNTEKIKYTDDGLKLIIKISNGDMRKVLNNLQSVFMAYDNITLINVSKCLGYPLEEDIKNIYNIICKNKYSDAYVQISTIIYENQYLLIDIINETHNYLINDLYLNKISEDKFKTIILNLRNIEINSLISIGEKLLIASFVASFYL